MIYIKPEFKEHFWFFFSSKIFCLKQNIFLRQKKNSLKIIHLIKKFIYKPNTFLILKVFNLCFTFQAQLNQIEIDKILCKFFQIFLSALSSQDWHKHMIISNILFNHQKNIVHCIYKFLNSALVVNFKAICLPLLHDTFCNTGRSVPSINIKLL